jgi:urea transport system substrate-binding protein
MPPGASEHRPPGSRHRRLLALSAISIVILVAAFLWRGQQGPPIRIGIIHSLSGTMAVSEAPLVDAVRLAVEEINAGGGLLGRPVEMVVADGRSDWGTFASEAERLIVEEKVSALFGCWTSACRKAVRPVVERHRHLLFYPVQYEGMEQSPNIVYLGSAPNQQIIPAVRWAFGHFGKRIYLIGSDYVFPRAAHQIVRDLAVASGATILAECYLSLGTAPDAALIDDIARHRPDLIVNTLNGDSNLAFFRALRDARLETLPVLSFSVSEVELKAIGQEAFHAAHYAAWSYFQSLPNAANRRFVDAFKARFGADRVTSDPIEAAYAGVRLWAEAVRTIGTEETEHVNRVIGRQSIPAPSGILAVDAGTRHLWKAFRVGRAREDGQFAQILVSDEYIRPTPFPGYRSVADWLALLHEQEVRTEHQP